MRSNNVQHIINDIINGRDKTKTSSPYFYHRDSCLCVYFKMAKHRSKVTFENSVHVL